MGAVRPAVHLEQTMHSDNETAIKTAAARLVATFARHDRDAYFACGSGKRATPHVLLDSQRRWAYGPANSAV